MWEIALYFALLGEVKTPTQEMETKSASREVEDLARKFRIRVYNEFRAQRDVYDQWSEAGATILKFSRSPTAPTSEQKVAAEWFRDALAFPRPQAQLPPLPVVVKEFTLRAAGEQQGTRTVPTSKHQSSLPWGHAAETLIGDPTDD